MAGNVASWSCGSDAVETLDPCFTELLKHPRAHIRAPGPGDDICIYRDGIDAPMRAIAGDAVTEVHNLRVRDSNRSVPLRLYRFDNVDTPAPVILFIHGGGFVSGSLDTHDAMCRTLCRQAKVSVLSVEYRLAPEHPYPAALDDCCAALRWVSQEGEKLGLDPFKIALCGDSAGGYLALAAALEILGQPFPGELRHIGLLYPVVDPSCATHSMDAFGEGYLLTRGALQWFWQAFRGSKEAEAVELSLLKSDLSGLPPVSVVVAGFDPLRDEGIALYERLKLAQVDVSLRHYGGMVHGFASLIHMTELATDATQYIAAEITASFERRKQAAPLPADQRQKVGAVGALSVKSTGAGFYQERVTSL